MPSADIARTAKALGLDPEALTRRLLALDSTGIGARLVDMTREQKQVAVRRLDEQGAFLLRGAVEDVANWMGVSKVTLYSYLNTISRS